MLSPKTLAAFGGEITQLTIALKTETWPLSERWCPCAVVDAVIGTPVNPVLWPA